MSRSPDTERRVLEEQGRHKPILKWVADVARKRIKEGRIVLVENGQSSRAMTLPDLERLDGFPDEIYDEEFEYVIGDQCTLGQKDWESGTPIRGRTEWGTNSRCLKLVFGNRCLGNHEHQHVVGHNVFGNRSAQKQSGHQLCAERH